MWIYNAKNVRYGLNEAERTLPHYNGIPPNDTSLGSSHPDVCSVVRADGSVVFLAEDIDVKLLRSIASRASEDLLVE